MTGVIDYGAGNLQSVCNALDFLAHPHRLVRTPGDICGIDRLIFPGVGAFGDSMTNLRSQGLDVTLCEWVKSDRPLLGICIGYQVLFEQSEEDPVAGLGIFQGTVQRFHDQPGLKVPHMGWNQLEIANSADPLWRGLPPDPQVYFVHSFYPIPTDQSIVSAYCTYGAIRFAAAIRKGNLVATQFHPEKSQKIGIRFIENFLKSA